MDVARITDERLRHALNSDQPSRERLCMAILALDRNYSEIRPRRPEGGPDGGRDIECLRGPDLCFGAVGFLNNVSDSAADKRKIKRKFADDLDAARKENRDAKAFVFFTNVDLTPSEVAQLKQSAQARGISFVDVYWRERMRHALDGSEGLAIRYQYLSIPMSEAEQASFFSRFGQDLERLVTGRFERLEKKIDLLEFARWQAGRIRSLNLHVVFKAAEESKRSQPEHFRICLELQSVVHEKRSVILGGQDDYWESGDGHWYLGTRTFFFRQRYGRIEESWIPQGPRVGGGFIGGLHFGVKWLPVSEVLAAEFDDLSLNFHFTENLLDRIARVKFAVDSYVFLDSELHQSNVDYIKPSLGWPSPLTEEQAQVNWRFCDFGWVRYDRLPRIKE